MFAYYQTIHKIIYDIIYIIYVCMYRRKSDLVEINKNQILTVFYLKLNILCQTK